MAQVTLGNFFSAGGRTVLGGAGGSGIDTKSLVEALTNAKALPATQKQDKIKLNDSKAAALAEFQKLLTAFKDASSALRNPPGVANAANNAFQYTTASISSNTSISGDNYVSVSSSPGAALQSYTISDITSLARAKKQSTGNISIATAESAAVSSTPSGGQLKAGTFTLKGKNGEARSITLNNGESLNSVAAKINAVSDKTGISASIVKISSGTYQLSFSATKTGEDSDFDFNNVDVPGTLVDTGGVFSSVTISDKQDASNAEFEFNGVAVTRQSNTITDLVEGVTFNIKQDTLAAPSTEITAVIKPDETIVKSNIISLLNAYNDLKIFSAKQNEINDNGTYKDTAVLHDNAAFRSTISSITTQLSSFVAGLSSNTSRSMSDIGITFTDQAATTDTPEVRNIFTIDDGKLTSAIADNPDAVRKIFEFSFSSDNTALRVFSRTNALGVNDFALKINPYATQTTQAITVADADTAIVSASPAAGEFKAGTLHINGQEIELEVGDTLNDIISKFTAVAGDSGLAASLNTLSAGSYSLTFTSTLTGAGKNFNLESSAVDPDGVFNALSISSTASYKATYDPGSGNVDIDVDATPLKDTNGVVTGYTIKGKTGTVLDGLVMIYTSTYSGVANVSLTQGVADKAYNVVDPVLTKNTGTIAVELEALKNSDARLSDEINKINDQVEIYRQQLLEKFARMEQAISSVNTLLASLAANDDARNGANS